MRPLPDELARDKATLRRYFKELRGALSPDHRRQASRAIAERLVTLPVYRDCETLLLYAPIGSEADPLPLFSRALADGKRVALPRSHREERALTFHAVTDLAQLAVGAYGIREPSATIPPLTDFSEALCLVPALAFDRRGVRLGYGGGYYDRFLSSFPGVSVGLAFGDCLCDRLPCHSHDRRVDLILTEGGATTPDEAI